MKLGIRMLVVAAVLAMASAATAAGDEEEVALDKVPAAVREAVLARFSGAELKGAVQEKEDDGRDVFEITLSHKKQDIDVTLTQEGEILLIETKITAKALPEAVSKSLAKKYPQAKYVIVEEIVKVEKKKERLECYEVLLALADGNKLEVQVKADGGILNEEKKSDQEKSDQGK